MRQNSWGWSPTGRRRWTMAFLLVGHALWMTLGRGPSSRWQHLANLLAAPPRAAAGRWETWRSSRQDKVSSLRQAQSELIGLRAQVNQLLTAREAEAPRLAEADEAVRLLGLKKLLPLEFRAARVIVNVRKAPFGGMILNQGLDAGLVPDQGVIAPEGVVGRLWDVGPTQASLLPLDAYNASTGVMLARSRATGVLQGLGPGKAAIRYISNQEVVQVGEPVFTSGLDRVFPRGLLVGYVSAVQPHDVELHVEVVLAAPLDRVGLVLILPSHPQMEIQPPAGPPQAAPGKQAAP
ncbi:MAG: rod shape-determining protein MreC [Holophaga sp.]|nr:rod shape-determining protein MreC [Holophaga sp.]